MLLIYDSNGAFCITAFTQTCFECLPECRAKQVQCQGGKGETTEDEQGVTRSANHLGTEDGLLGELD